MNLMDPTAKPNPAVLTVRAQLSSHSGDHDVHPGIQTITGDLLRALVKYRNISLNCNMNLN